MKLKTLSLLLAFVLVLTMFAACGSNSDSDTPATDDAAATAPAEEAAEPPVGFSRGTISEDGKTYTNDFLGVSFTLPEGWEFADQDYIDNIMNAGAEYTGADVSELSSIYDMMAVNSADNTNITVMFENLTLTPGAGSMTAEEYAGTLSEQLTSFEEFAYEASELTTKKLAGEDYVVLNTAVPDYGTYQDYYIRRIGDYMAAILFSGGNSPASDGLDVLFTAK